MASACGEYVGEALVSDSGAYLGDFTGGTAIDAPLGWSRSMAFAWGSYRPYCPSAHRTFQCCALPDWIMAPWWDPPWLIDGCNIIFQPRVPLSMPFGSTYTGLLNGSVFDDDSGPAGLEGVPAIELDLAGSGHGSLAFIGEQASLHSGFSEDDYATAWMPEIGSQWVWQAWAKIVPDSNGYSIPDGHLQFGYGRMNTAVLLPHSPADDDLTDDWKFFQAVFTVIPWLSDAHPAIPYITFRSEDAVYRETRLIEMYCKEFAMTKWAPKGRVRVKCAHLYPLGAAVAGGNWCDNFHGHG